MQSINGSVATERLSESRFRSECAICLAPLGGRLVVQKLLTAEDIVELLGAIVSLRTITAWLRESWSGGVRMAGLRSRAVSSSAFVLALEQRKRQPGRARRPLGGARPRPLRSTCPSCEGELGGIVAPVGMLTVADMGHLVGVRDSVIESWIHAGQVRAFRLPGVRGLVADENEFQQDFEALLRNPQSGVRP